MSRASAEPSANANLALTCRIHTRRDRLDRGCERAVRAESRVVTTVITGPAASVEHASIVNKTSWTLAAQL